MCTSAGKDFPKEEIARAWIRSDGGMVVGGILEARVAGARGGGRGWGRGLIGQFKQVSSQTSRPLRGLAVLRRGKAGSDFCLRPLLLLC